MLFPQTCDGSEGKRHSISHFTDQSHHNEVFAVSQPKGELSPSYGPGYTPAGTSDDLPPPDYDIGAVGVLTDDGKCTKKLQTLSRS